jgi:hypothetical protein
MTGDTTVEYESPRVVDFGSIADHTFSRCNPTGAQPGPGGNVPRKGSDQVPFHFDNMQECSGLS